MNERELQNLILNDAGFDAEETKEKNREEFLILKDAGFPDDELTDSFGFPNTEKNKTVEPIQTYWQSIWKGIKDEAEFRTGALKEQVTKDVKQTKQFLVGEDAEWQKYWERGVGKSTINLALQYHSKGDIGYDAKNALLPEPEDTGVLERWFESISNIGADLPVYLPAGFLGTAATGGNVFAGGATAGFVNESIRGMYIEALDRGQVNTFSEWWDIFIDHGFKEGVKSGLTLGTAMALPGWVGAKTLMGKYAAQYGAFTGMGTILEGQLPSRDELINTALVLGTFGIGEKGARMVTQRVKETDKTHSKVVDEILNEPRKLEDAASVNIEKFRDSPKGSEKPEPFKPNTEPKQSVLTQEKKVEVEKPTIETRESVNKVNEQIQFEMPKQTEGLTNIKSQIVTQYFDKLHPIFNVVKKAREAGNKFENTVDPYVQARVQPGMIGRAMHFIQFGTFKANTLKLDGGKSLLKILEPIKTEKDYKDFTSYVVSKRSIEKEAQGKKTGIDQVAARDVVKNFNDKYEATFRELNEYQGKLTEYLVDSGIISKETAAKIFEANKDYVPFYRVLEEGLSDANAKFGKGITNPLKTFKGSERKIINPLESVHLNTIHFITLAERNKTNIKFVEMIEKTPDVFPEMGKVPSKLKQTRVTVEELSKVLEDVGAIKPEALQGFSVFRRNSQDAGPSEIVVFRNGKREVWEVGTEVATALKDASGTSQNILMRFLSTPSSLLRAGSTLSPDFILRNFKRDTVSAAIYSDKNFIPIYHTAMGFWHMLGRTDLYKEWTRSGAMQSMFISMDRRYFSKDLKAQLTKGKVRNLVSNPLEMLRILSEIFESGSRIGQYKISLDAYKKRGRLTDRDVVEKSGFDARDITIDFAKMGNKIQGWNRITSFFNARLQGYVKIVDAFKQRPVKTSAAIFTTITLPSILLWSVNHDNPTYRELPQWQKDLFWIVITGEGENEIVYRIPKPFEPGLLFGTGAERMLDFAFKKDPQSVTKFFAEMGKDNLFNLGPIPDFIKPFIEFYANRSLFSDRPIVPRRVEPLLSQYEYTEYTSATAKLLGKTIAELNLAIGVADSPMASPAKIDHLIRGWTGTLGQYALELSDVAIKKLGLIKEPIEPAKTLADTPVIKAFIVRHPSMGAEPITRFYKEYNKIKDRVTTAKKLSKDLNFEEVKEVFRQTEYNKLPLVEIAEAMSNIQSTIRLIYNNDGFSATDKRQMIDESYRSMILLAKEGLNIVSAFE
jgi:hypothetical protein